MKKLLLILLFAAVTASAEKIQDMPVALVPLDADAEKLEALVLAQSSGIDFLERSEIDKLKRELKLSAANLTGDAFSIDFKKIKNVRIFALLSSNNIIIFDARSGIRLENSDFTGSLEQRAETAIERLKQATTKAEQAQSGKILYLGFMPLTPINLSAGELKIAKHAERLLQQQMNSKTNMAVLERHHLKLLLDEPNPDTEKLLASSLLIRLAAKKGEKGKIILNAYTSVPGKPTQTTYSEILLDPGKAMAPQIRAFLAFDNKSAGSGERQAEAQNLAAQAEFAAQHLLLNNAVSLAASATALSRQQQLLLADVCAIAAYRAWEYWSGIRMDKMDYFLDNLETAVRIVVKLRADRNYNHNFMQMIRKLGYMSRRNFEKMSPEQQRHLHAIMELYFTAWHRNNRYLLKAPGTKRPSVRERLQYLNNRGEYLHKFSNRLDMAWDYSYFGRYILSVLPGYIKDMNDLVPEIKKFYAAKREKRYDLYGLDNIQLLNRSSLGDFGNRPLSLYKGDNREILRKTIALMKSSKSISLAQRGARAEFEMSNKGNSKTYAAETLQRFKTCEKLYFENSDPALGMNLDQGDIDLNIQIQIWNTAIERFGNYRIFIDSLLKNCGKLPAKEAADLYKLVTRRRAERRKDPRVKLPHGMDHDWVDRNFMLLLNELEKQFPSLAPVQAPLPESPFVKVINPCPQYKYNNGYHVGNCVWHDDKIYFTVIRSRETYLVSIDPAENFAVKEYKSLQGKQGMPWCGGAILTALTKQHLAIQNGPWVALYPLNGEQPKRIDFSDYYNGSNNGIAGAEDRLFLSYGKWAGNKQPGILLEYNLQTGEKKVLASTLDRDIDWPLKGRKRLFHIIQMAVDPKQKCLLTLFPADKDARPGRVRYNCYLYGYFWEKKTWKRLSEKLYLSLSETQILVEEDGIYLNYRDDAVWKLKRDGGVEKLWDVSARGYTANVPVKEPGLQRYYVYCYNNAVVYTRNALFFTKEKRMFRFSKPILEESFFSSIGVFADKYLVITRTAHGITIGVLKKFKNGELVE